MSNDTVAALRDQVANLRAELSNLKARRAEDMAHVEKLLKERDAALVEVKRLRVDERDLFSRYEMALQTCREAESRLAAATELLPEARRALDDMLERYQSMGLTSIKAQAVAGRLRAFLAAQPAAPAISMAKVREMYDAWDAPVQGQPAAAAPVCGACGHRESKPCGADDCPLQSYTIPRI